ncbi:MAG: beta-mannosidase [Ignavibacteriae bacterium]|nr:beta-mannosidase [Ignavibacteriota bacterium]
MRIHKRINASMKNIYIKLLCIATITITISSCKLENKGQNYQARIGVKLVNNSATYNTTNLFYNLKTLSNTKIIFGHHHATAYGIGWENEKDRSDVKDAVGAYPGLIGWDFADFSLIGDKRYFQLQSLIVEAHEKGIINTFAWHYDNPITGKNFYDTTIVVKHLLPGGTHNKTYNNKLDIIANFTKHLVGNDGKVIPIIFRPFHEMDGNWFWWGKNFCTPEEFVALWQYTVEYLRDYRNVKNILFAFSPDRNFYSENDYKERYPGDEYVDILGMDNYYDFDPDGDGLEGIKSKLKILTKIAKQSGKVAAFTETGSETIPDKTWWTEKLLNVIDDDSINIAYVMVWRNAHKNHFYAPYKGHQSVPDFKKFKENPKIIFADEMPNMFKEN